MPRVAVFDLDGTLLDTLDDLHAAVCRALARASLPLRTREEIRAFVGDGVELVHFCFFYRKRGHSKN